MSPQIADEPTSDIKHEWACRWSEGELTLARDEEWARKHARMFGTTPVRRVVGPWTEAS